ncbi:MULTISPECIES: Bax inhibitor-1/YccA family protein [unclassified Nocardioides]|uniref:Bax inhibitor-1/YccA family protein n=1 Tax=Nocardioides sp. URHA0032 TaxID=1380388 RepID=UPI00048FEF3B|nr:Bax inhibitor-1/YccA family protein [Nocardioides sp. URHA0032]
MQSNNPVFRRSEEFNRPGGTAAYADQGYTDPSTWSTGGAQGTPGTPPTTVQQPMTIDSVVMKTGISLAVVIITAAITWVLSPDVDQNTDASAISGLIAAATIGSLLAFVLSMVNSFKRVISPALVLLFCAAEGVALGAISKVFDLAYPGVVTSAVIGTFGAFAGTLAVYKFFNIKVSDKFRRMVIAAMLGVVAISLIEVVLSAFGAQLGLFGDGKLGLLFAVVGLALGVFMLVLDFDFVEQGVANRLPDREGWRAAFAMTVSLVWIYTNLLRILAIMRGD